MSDSDRVERLAHPGDGSALCVGIPVSIPPSLYLPVSLPPPLSTFLSLDLPLSTYLSLYLPLSLSGC